MKYQKISQVIVLTILMLFLTPNLGATFDDTGRKTVNHSSMSESSITHELSKCFENLNLEPICKENADREFYCDQVFEDSEIGKVCVIGKLFTDNDQFVSWAYFSIDRGWFYNSTKLEYLTLDANHFPDLSIIDHARTDIKALNPQIDETFHILIEPVKIAEPHRKGINAQRWTFFNPTQRVEEILIFFTSPDGGVNYRIMKKSSD